MYKVFMFGHPSIIVTTPEACRRVLNDDDGFKPGWPTSTEKLMGRKSFVSIPDQEHKWLRKLTSAPVNGFEALTVYMKYIEENVIIALEKWENMGQIELLTELRRLTFKIIMHIFLSSEGEHVREVLEKEYTALNYGVRAMAINVPGFAYHNALKVMRFARFFVRSFAGWLIFGVGGFRHESGLWLCWVLYVVSEGRRERRIHRGRGET